MFVVIYQFEVKNEQSAKFIKLWHKLTQLIKTHAHSLGSRLHQKNENVYIAYAQWPDQMTFKNSGENLPSSVNEIRQQMRNVCTTITRLHELKLVDDLLQNITT